MDALNNLNNTYYSYGLGYFISKIEYKMFKLIKTVFEMLKNYTCTKYKLFIDFICMNILNTEKLNTFSKIVIISAICIHLLRIFVNIIFKKTIILERCSFTLNKFFGSNVLKNKSSLLDKESKIKLTTKDENWMKIKNFVENRNQTVKKYTDREESVNNPFFKIMKFYIDYGRNKNF